MSDWALNTPPLKILSKDFFIKIVKVKSQFIQLKLVKIYIMSQLSNFLKLKGLLCIEGSSVYSFPSDMSPLPDTAQKMKFSINDFFSKCD